MKEIFHTYFTSIRSDRPLFLQSLLIAVLGIVYIIYAALSLSPTDIQIATRFTSFGTTQYYRTKWFYLLTLVVLGVVMVLSHIALIAKLKERQMRSLALAFGWLTTIMLGLLFFYTYSILGVAYLN